MDLSAFYAVVSGVNFTLLGLWWVAVNDRVELRSSRLAYVVSLQFVIPGTVSLLSQVAPDAPLLWRSAFTLAGVAGAAAVLLMSHEVAGAARAAAALLRFGAVPLYLAVAVVAAVPGATEAAKPTFTSLQIEAILLCLLVFLGVQSAWWIAMAPAAPQAED
ncbi:hypothetical protein Val02_08230 [Virgisporangium aliadipatigenens]|uniref:Uncharacterized protein n=1 Tax=Virgisporangium aliadipatigenens TaxID=741659 RepID=A0A8J3YGE9_9ACTN|nr:hypothetical protein [Virgisporangium aliadipatigenens]GIJ43937.1 hypothetical protein Val02_08230 [Virgisporangium aliadipatigenens]